MHYLLRQTSFEQGLPALPSFNPLTRLIQCEPARPGRKWLRRIISVKFLPKSDGRLLNNILRIRDIRNQRGHIPKDFPLTAQKQREKLLLGSVLVPKTVHRIRRHEADSINTSALREKLDKLFFADFPIHPRIPSLLSLFQLRGEGRFSSAMEHAGKVLVARLGNKDHPDYKPRLGRWAKQLLKDNVEKLIAQARQECAGTPQAGAVEKELGYFVNNVARMQYGTFRHKGCSQRLPASRRVAEEFCPAPKLFSRTVFSLHSRHEIDQIAPFLGHVSEPSKNYANLHPIIIRSRSEPISSKVIAHNTDVIVRHCCSGWAGHIQLRC